MGFFSSHDCTTDGCSPEPTSDLMRRCSYCGRVYDFRDNDPVTYLDPDHTNLRPSQRGSSGSIFDWF